MKAFILAGGFATRLWPLTEHRAKPLLPLAGKPLLSHIVSMIPAEIPVTVSTNAAFGASFEEWKKTINRPNLQIRIEQTKSDDEKLGTLGATAQWITQEQISDDILLLTGDNYFGFTMQTFLQAFHGTAALVAAFDIGDISKASAFGTILVDSDGKTITGFEEKPAEPKTSLVSTGCSILPKGVIPDLLAFAKVKPDNVGGIFEELLRLGKRVECFRFEEQWFDIGSFETYLEATQALVGDAVLLGEGSTMTDSTSEGSVVAGVKNSITKSKLQNTVLFDNCIIDDCVLERCVIDDGCELRGVDLTGKMIRRNTRLIRKD
ncbi:NDP-sugar synthase [Candidatus Peribacteria bacterium]|nr:MAG: NDP-sugar synthase [Candidatus Peribacteria bacterium]